MNIDNHGQIILTKEEAFKSLYSGKIKDFSNVHLEDISVVDQFNTAIQNNADNIPKLKVYEIPTCSVEVADQNNQKNWFMPKEYEEFPMVEFLLDKTQNEEQYQRVVAELDLFIQHDMMGLLNYIKYLVDTMRQHNIVWGVGRGSSVASYVLYLIGIHKIDSMKYDLDIKEFLK